MTDAEKHREYYQRPLPERYAAEQEQTAGYYGKGQSLFAGWGSAVEYPEDKIREKQQSAAKEVYKEILYRSEAELIQTYADYNNDGNKKTLDEIGSIYGVSRERIRQIENRAISKLKKLCKNKNLTSGLKNYFGG